MESHDQLKWSTFIVLILFCTGCRLGNRTETQPTQKTNSDPYSGYYVTAPKSLIFSVKTTTSITKSQDISQIPAEISDYLTNPVALVLTNSQTGKAALTSPAMLNSAQPSSLPVYIHADDSLTFHGQSSPTTLWDDANCKTYLDFQESGILNRTSNVNNPSGNTLPLNGQLRISLQMVNVLTGDCTATLQFFENCYQDVTVCGGSTASENTKIQSAIQATFKPYIDAGAMSLLDFPNITQYGYLAEYE